MCTRKIILIRTYLHYLIMHTRKIKLVITFFGYLIEYIRKIILIKTYLDYLIKYTGNIILVKIPFGYLTEYTETIILVETSLGYFTTYTQKIPLVETSLARAAICFRIITACGELHNGFVSDQLTINSEVKPRAIVSGVRRSVREDHFTLVPALVALPNIREIYTTLAVSTMTDIVQQVYATFVVVLQRYASVVPREHRAALSNQSKRGSVRCRHLIG